MNSFILMMAVVVAIGDGRRSCERKHQKVNTWLVDRVTCVAVNWVKPGKRKRSRNTRKHGECLC